MRQKLSESINEELESDRDDIRGGYGEFRARPPAIATETQPLIALTAHAEDGFHLRHRRREQGAETREEAGHETHGREARHALAEHPPANHALSGLTEPTVPRRDRSSARRIDRRARPP
jgi:hypothetical protein